MSAAVPDLEPLEPHEIDHIEEWVGTPEEFLLAGIFDTVKEHEADISESIKRLILTIRTSEARVKALQDERVELIALVKEAWEIVEKHYPNLKKRWDTILAGIADGSVALDALDTAEAEARTQAKRVAALEGALRDMIDNQSGYYLPKAIERARSLLGAEEGEG